MKDKIHPKLNNVVFVDVMSGAEFVATSTLRSDETRKIDGKEHFVIKVETSSASHPFYTGKRRNDVRNDQVAKFIARVAKAQDKNKPKTAKPEEIAEVIAEKPKAAKEAPAEKVKKTVKKAPAKSKKKA